MKSHLSLLYIALQQRISAITIGGKKAIKWIDHEMGQLDFERPPLDYPAVLIDFPRGDFSDLTDNAQLGVEQVILRLVFAPYTPTNNITPLEWREKGLDYYELEQALHEAIQGWSPQYMKLITPANPEAEPPQQAVYEDLLEDVFGSFDRTAHTTSRRRTDYKIRDLAYTIGVDDDTTRIDVDYIPADVHINPQLTLDTGTDTDAEIIDL